MTGEQEAESLSYILARIQEAEREIQVLLMAPGGPERLPMRLKYGQWLSHLAEVRIDLLVRAELLQKGGEGG